MLNRGLKGLVRKEVAQWSEVTCQEILRVRPPRLAKNALAQCYIKLFFIAEIGQNFFEIIQITLKVLKLSN